MQFMVSHFPGFKICLFVDTLYDSLHGGDQPVTRHLHTQDNTKTENADIHPCPEWDQNLWSQCSNSTEQYMPCFHCDWLNIAFYTKLKNQSWRCCRHLEDFRVSQWWLWRLLSSGMFWCVVWQCLGGTCVEEMIWIQGKRLSSEQTVGVRRKE